MIKKPELYIKNFINKFDKTDLFILVTTFIIGIITNFSFIVTRGLAPDALSSTNEHIAGLWETQLGRFSLQIFDNIRFGFVNRFLVILVAILAVSISIMMIRRIFKLKSKLLLFVSSALIMTAPIFTESYMYLYCADSYLIAFASATFTIFSISKIKTIKEDKKWCLLAILATAFTCSLYQAYLGVIAGLFIAYTIKEIIEKDLKEALKIFARNVILIGLGICFYYVAFRIICKLLHTKPSSYKGANNLGLATLLALPESITHAYMDFFNFFFADIAIINNNFYHRSILYVILLAIFVIALILCIKNLKKNRIQKTFAILLAIALFPIATNIMDVIATGTRINLVTGPGLITTTVLYVYVLNTLKDKTFSNISYAIGNILLICIAWTFLISNTWTYIIRDQQYKSFETTLSDIYTKASSLEGYKSDMTFLFSNMISVPQDEFEKTTGMVTKTSISWPRYAGVKRYSYFYKKYLGLDINTTDESQYADIVKTKDFKAMSVYPNADSIRIINNTVVIKISDELLLNDEGKVKLW